MDDVIRIARVSPYWSWSQALYLAFALISGVSAVHELARRSVMRLLANGSLGVALWNRCAWPVRCLLPLLALTWVWRQLDPAQASVETVRHLNLVSIVLAACWLGDRIVYVVATGPSPAASSDVGDPAWRVTARTRWLRRASSAFIWTTGTAFTLMTFPSARHVGASLLASAGAMGLALGVAARPILSNMLAGFQIAATQQFKIGDMLTVQDRCGTIQELTPTCVVLRLSDHSHLRIPMHWFLEHPVQHWARESQDFVAEIMLWVDYAMPVHILRQSLESACRSSPEWNGRQCRLQVWNATAQGVQLRVEVGMRDAAHSSDVCCHVREALIATLQAHARCSLPRQRLVIDAPSNSFTVAGGDAERLEHQAFCGPSPASVPPWHAEPPGS
jgi:small-conductance mechanosensitive channel